MNQRDQNQTSGRRGGRQQQETSGRQGGRFGGRSQQDEDWSSQRHGGGRDSAGLRFGETYNPEPQWLRDDRERGGYASLGREEDNDRNDFRGNYGSYGTSGQGEFQGRGSHAGSGRAWGEDPEFRSHLGGYGNEYPGRSGYGGMGAERGGFGERGFGEREERGYGGYGERAYGERGMSASRHADTQGPRAYGRDWGGRDTGSGYGAQSRSQGGGLHEYGTPGYETSGYDRDFGHGGGTMSGRGYGSQYRGGSETGYGSRSGYQLGSHQGDTGYQRSYRGLGPQSYKRPDERIRDDVYERLTDDDRIDARQVMVDVNQGNVTLTGTVPERQMRYAAEDLVESCMGVANINNQLKVQRESSQGSGLSGSASASSTGSTPAPGSTSTGAADAKH